MNSPLVSIVIASKNSAEYIEACLRSVRAQTYQSIEIIVVDNFSRDGTADIARRFTDKVYQIGPERSSQVNFGVLKSSGIYIYRIDSDYVLKPNVVQVCVDALRKGYDAVATHNVSAGSSIWAHVRRLERDSYKGKSDIVAVRCMRKDVFEDVGGFDECLIAGEDYDLHNRIVGRGYAWTHVNAVEYHIGEPKNIWDVWKKFYYYGRTIRRYTRKHPRMAKKQMMVFRPSFRSVQSEIRSSVKIYMAFHIYLFVKIAASMAGMIRGAPKELRGCKSR